jgi:hypothetical protein
MPYSVLKPYLGTNDSKCKEPVSLLATLWNDNKLSAILSTFADPRMIEWYRKSKHAGYKKVRKPLAHILYSAIMDAVDVVDRNLTGIGINIRTRKWYLNVFCMILSAAIVETYHCFQEEHGDDALPREIAIGRLINECSRAKATNRGHLTTTLPKQAPPVIKEKIRFKRRRLFSPAPARKTHILVPMYTAGQNKKRKKSCCGYCVKSLGLSGSSRKTKRAKRTHLFCIGCEMYLCAACQIKFKIHSNAVKSL